MQEVEILDRAVHVGRVEPQRLLQFAQHAHEVDDEADSLAPAVRVHVRAVHARDGLQEHVVAHRFVEVQAIEQRRVVARQQFVGDDQDSRVFARLFEPEADVGLALRRKLEFGDERALDDVRGVLGVHRLGPRGRQPGVQRAFVLGAGFAVHADEERLVAERRHVFPKMFGDEIRDLLDTVVRGQKRPQADGAVERGVEFLDVGHAFGLGQGEELAVEPLRGHRHLARSHAVADRQRGFVPDRLADGVFVEIPACVVGAEDRERAFPVRGPVDRRAGKADDGRVGQRGHQVRTQVSGDRTVRLVDEHEDVVACVGVLLDALELVDHGQDQAAPVGREQIPQGGPGMRMLDRDILLLHLAEQPFDPAPELSFQIGTVHDDDHRRRVEVVFAFQDQARRGQQRKRLAGALRMPDQPAAFGRRGAAFHDAVHRAALMLAQHRLPRLAVLDVEQNPVPQRPQKRGRLEERLDREPIAVVRAFLPARHEAARGVPRHAVPVVEQVRDVEELHRPQQFGRFRLVASHLHDALFDGVAVRGILVLDDGGRHAVDDEHHVRTVPFAGRGRERPLPGDVQRVGARRVEIDQPDGPLPAFGLVIPLPFTAQPGEHLAVAFDRRRQRLDPFDRGAHGLVAQPRVASMQRRFHLVVEQHPGLAPTLA